jgi:hypothetical protein
MKKSRVFLWCVVVAMSITGIALHLMAPDSDDELPNSLIGLMRELHGAAIFLAIFMFGYFFANHVQKKLAKYKLKGRAQVWDGYCHVSVWILLIVSGLLLYYPQDILESLPAINIPAIHWYTGLILLALFPWHFWRDLIGRLRARKRYQSTRNGTR